MKVDDIMTDCRICPRLCGVDRRNTTGNCGCGDSVRVNIAQLHYHEEPVISGTRGSGTIFFAGCNMHCVYCQNAIISQDCRGTDYSPEKLVEAMLELEAQGAHNINLVTGTHFTPHLVKAIEQAKLRGLDVPIVWNSSGYELVETLRMLDGLVDIYLPDFRYWDGGSSKKYSLAPEYASYARSAISEMFRQVGHIRCDRRGLAWRGLMIRLLVLPHDINGIERIIRWIAEEIGPETWISLMGQYYPTHRAVDYVELSRAIQPGEYARAVKALEQYGLENGYVQEIGSDSSYTPDFKK